VADDDPFLAYLKSIDGRVLRPVELALLLHFISASESIDHHDSADQGWREHRLRRRLSFGRRRCEM
jgi:hypothetical protein